MVYPADTIVTVIDSTQSCICICDKIFDKIMKISRSARFEMKISRFFLQEGMLARPIASFAIAAGEMIFSVANFF